MVIKQTGAVIDSDSLQQALIPKNLVVPVSTRRQAIVFGDSIAGNCTDITPTGWTQIYFQGFFLHANMRLNGALNLVANCGVPGNTSTQALARMGTGATGATTCDPLAFPHDTCIIVIGTNDAPSDTSLSANQRAQATIANIKAMVNIEQNYGALVALATVPPKTSDASATTALGGLQRSWRRQVNSWIRQFCKSQGGPVLFDFFHAVTVSGTESWIANSSIDGTHPNYQGCSYMGAALATALSQFVVPSDTGGVDQFEWYAANGSAQGSNVSGTNGTTLVSVTGAAPSGWVASTSATGAAVGSVVGITAGSVFQDRKAQLAITATANYDGAIYRIGGLETGSAGAWCVANALSGSRWAGATAIPYGDRCVPTGSTVNAAYTGLWAQCVVGGTTSASEPTWPTQAGQQVADGSVTWEMVQSPFSIQRNQVYGSAFYVGIGAIVRPATPTGFHYICTQAGLTAAAADPLYSNVLNGTTIDGTVGWTSIAIPSYSYYAEFDFSISGLTSSAGCLIRAFLNIVDDGGTTTQVYGSSSDITPGNFSANSSAWNPPASGRIITPILTLGANKGMRFMNAQIGAYCDASATMNFQASRVSIRPVIQL